jgi:hypothetical protein
MSASNGDSASNHLNATTVSVDSAQRVTMFGWIKPNSTTLTAVNALAQLAIDGSNTSPNMTVGQTSGPDRFTGGAGSGSTATATGFSVGTWASVAFDYGPYDGTSRTQTLYTSGVSRATQNTTIAGAGAIMDTIRVLNRLAGGTGFLKGPGAEIAIAVGLTDLELTNLLTKQQTLHVGAWSSAKIVHAWRLLSNATATIGGVDLTATGSPTFDSGDHPAVGDAPAASQRIVRTMVFS